jgi:hypothetical protein
MTAMVATTLPCSRWHETKARLHKSKSELAARDGTTIRSESSFEKGRGTGGNLKVKKGIGETNSDGRHASMQQEMTAQ